MRNTRKRQHTKEFLDLVDKITSKGIMQKVICEKLNVRTSIIAEMRKNKASATLEMIVDLKDAFSDFIDNEGEYHKDETAERLEKIEQEIARLTEENNEQRKLILKLLNQKL